MINQQILQGNWNEIRGKLKSRWAELTDDELRQAEGNVEQLVGLIQRKTGEGREQIERVIDELASQGAGMMEQAAEKWHHTSEQLGEQFRQGYAHAEAALRERPGQSLAAVFGIGIAAGLVLGLLLRGR